MPAYLMPDFKARSKRSYKIRNFVINAKTDFPRCYSYSFQLRYQLIVVKTQGYNNKSTIKKHVYQNFIP